jgi:hypothetical protein
MPIVKTEITQACFQHDAHKRVMNALGVGMVIAAHATDMLKMVATFNGGANPSGELALTF